MPVVRPYGPSKASSLVGAEGLEPRPSTCNGGKKVQVKGLSRSFGVPLSDRHYLGVPPSCYAKGYARPGCWRCSAIAWSNELGVDRAGSTATSSSRGHRLEDLAGSVLGRVAHGGGPIEVDVESARSIRGVHRHRGRHAVAAGRQDRGRPGPADEVFGGVKLSG
jgi:hypothetical protein